MGERATGILDFDGFAAAGGEAGGSFSSSSKTIDASSITSSALPENPEFA